MRNTKAIALILTAGLILVSCSKGGKSAEELALEVRTDFLEAETLIIGADITADYGDRVYEFAIKYAGNGETGEISILSPEEIAGMTAEVTPGSCTLVYDGARLDTGALTGGGLSPAAALPVLISEWRNGHIEYSGFEKLGAAETVTITTAIDDSSGQKTWFDVKTRLPVRAEISENGRTVIACAFNNVAAE